MSRLTFKESLRDDNREERGVGNGQRRHSFGSNASKGFTAGVVIDVDSDTDDNDPLKPYSVGRSVRKLYGDAASQRSDTFALLGVKDIRDRKRNRNELHADSVHAPSNSTKKPRVITVDLTAENDDNENDKPKGSGLPLVADVGTSSSSSSSAAGKSSSSKKKKRKRDAEMSAESTPKSSYSESSAPLSTDDLPALARSSAFLTRFLTMKRDAAAVPPAPPIDLASDVYLREFNQSFSGGNKLVGSTAGAEGGSNSSSSSSSGIKEENDGAGACALQLLHRSAADRSDYEAASARGGEESGAEQETFDGDENEGDEDAEDDDNHSDDNDSDDDNADDDNDDDEDGDSSDDDEGQTGASKAGANSDKKTNDDEPERSAWLLELDVANLPFQMTAKQFKKLIEKKGYKVTKSYMNQQKQRKGTNDGTGVVVIDLRQSPAMLAHAAGLEYAKGRKAKLARKAKMKKLTTAAIPVAIGKCLETLHGMQLHGRTIRVQRRGHGLLQALSKVMAGESSRYFAGANISTKCMNCGQVGHTQKSCGNAPLPTPCHLCAGSDHDAGRCPNITCYRCGCFGHHSRDCRGRNLARPRVCTLCGGTNHEQHQCLNQAQQGPLGRTGDMVRDQNNNLLMAGPYVKCMSCNRYGHTLCHKLPKVKSSNAAFGEIYCPNCGEEGHHVDYPVLSYMRNIEMMSAKEPNRKRQRHSTGGMINLPKYGCQEPRHDAFMKYNQLVNDIGRNIKDKAEYLRRLLPRHPNANELQLFPALAEAPPDLQVPRPYASPPRGGRGEHVIFDDNDDYPQYYPDTSNRISSSSGGGGGSSGGNNSSSSSSGRRVYVGDLDDGMRSAGRAHKQRRKSAPYK